VRKAERGVERDEVGRWSRNVKIEKVRKPIYCKVRQGKNNKYEEQLKRKYKDEKRRERMGG